MILQTFTIIIFLYSVTARTLRWLSIWQQKEYRLDRLWEYLKTTEGREQWRQLVDFPLHKTKLRRPRPTPKAILILLTAMGLFLAFQPGTIIQLAGMYLLVPLFVILGTVPAWLITQAFGYYYTNQAQKQIQLHRPKIIGVSGSYGKTTTKILLGELLRQKYQVWVSPKSHNTPLSIAQALAKTYRGEEIIILEYAAYKVGEIASLARAYPADMAVFTGINNQHLALFGSREKMLQAETELFSSLSAPSQIFYNDADEEVAKVIKKFSDHDLIPASDRKLAKVKLNQSGYLGLGLAPKTETITTKLLGLHYLVNLQQAINVADHLGLSASQIKKALESFLPGEEFVRIKTNSAGVRFLIDDRTSNPDGFSTAIDLAKHISAQEKWLITAGIVDLGTAEAKEHRRLAQQAVKVFDKVVYTGVPGSEQFQVVCGDKFTRYELGQFEDMIQSLDQNSLILIEGKQPHEIGKYLDGLE